MTNLHVKNVPEALYERLRRHARKRDCSMSTVVLDAIERELTWWEWHERLAIQPETDLGTDAATLLAEARSERAKELE